jgi:acid phosphatase class B
MPIPPIQKQLVEKLMTAYCKNRIPKEVQDQIKLLYTIRGNNITLIESRPVWNDESKWTEMKIAQIRFENENKTFTLYCADRNDKWHLYDYIKPSKELEKILEEIDNDIAGAFWG